MSLPICKLCFLFLLSIYFIKAEQNACHQVTFRSGYITKWFGLDCKYMCHCMGFLNCDINGDCPKGCILGWFGPACQYADMMHDSSLQDRDRLSIITDYDNEPCTVSPLQITWNTPFFFTWMRVILDINETNKDLNIKFGVNSVNTECPSLNKVIIDDKTLDIFCPMSQRIQQIFITAPGIKLCSINVSGGRNVALRLNTSHSSTNSGQWPAAKVVDGNYGRNQVDSCLVIDGRNTTPKWTIEFQKDGFDVHQFKIYNRMDGYQEQLSGFHMDVFNDAKLKIYSFIDQPPTVDDLYTIQPTSQLLVSSVEITATKPFQNKTILSICEVEIFGDSTCSKDQETGKYKYGRDCDQLCHCAVPGEKCFVSTGNCPSGCKAGFYGQGCNSACRANFYGVDCLNRCNDSCKDHLCDPINGHCIKCEAPGKRPPVCVDDCFPGLYGSDCKYSCPSNCFQTSYICNSTTGNCLSCSPGFYGAHCTDLCPPCCKDPVCDIKTGRCLSSTSPLENADYEKGLTSGVGIGIGVMVAADIIIIIVVYFCTKRIKNPLAKPSDTTDRSYDRVGPIQQNEQPYHTVNDTGDDYIVIQDVVVSSQEN